MQKRPHIFLLSVFMLISATCLAEEEKGREHIADLISDFTEYGDALISFTKTFFSEIPNSFTHAQFRKVTEDLLEKINTIKAKCATYLTSNPSKNTEQLLKYFKSLAEEIIPSQEKFNTALHKNLGTKNLMSELKKVGTSEEKKLPKVNSFRGKINRILVQYDIALKKKIDTFFNNINYSFTYPKKNEYKALAATLRHSSPR